MKSLLQIKTSIPPILTLVLACFGLSPIARAVSPAPDGGYPGGNTAEGQSALFSLTTGGFNSAVGFFALKTNTASAFNTAIGAGALFASNTADGQLTAVGAGALFNNTSGGFNTATGAFALFANTTGAFNAAFGDCLYSNTLGSDNTAIGNGALALSTIGNDNTALGFQAGLNATTGDGNVYIGSGITGAAGEANHTYIRNIKDTTVSGTGTDVVTVNLTTGLLGHLASSRRYKEDIRPMDKTSEAVFALKPVTYHYKKEIDASQSPAFGLIAEDVAQVNPDLVARNSKGQPESVHYEMVNAMLLNEFLKEHGAFVEEQRKVEQQQKEIDVLKAELKEQRSLIQKVSNRVEMSRSTPQVVSNP